MNGARGYAKLFGEGELTVDKLLLRSGHHARGKTFHIYVLADDGSKIEVYGILGGHPGWTEYYGWLHAGKWQTDFAEIVERQKIMIADRKEYERIAAEQKQLDDEQRIKNLLAKY